MKFEDIFQSTSSIQRKTFLGKSFQSDVLYFNPLPLYRGRPTYPLPPLRPGIFQSTSSIQRKTKFPCMCPSKHIISIHFLYTEEDSSDSSPRASCTSFQSTSSIQRKTKARRTPHHKNTFQSTSSIQRKTASHIMSTPCDDISIHFLYTEEDNGRSIRYGHGGISIHFLYTEEDRISFI